MECAVCGKRTRERVRLIVSFESVPVCAERCRRLFLTYPGLYLEATTSANGRRR